MTVPPRQTFTASQVVDAADLNADIATAGAWLLNVPRVEVYRTADQTISDSTETTVTWNAETFDTHGMHSTGTNTNRLTAAEDGLYLVYAYISFAANAANARYCALRDGAAAYFARCQRKPPSAASAARLNAYGLYPLTAGDWVECRVYQNSGGNLGMVCSSSRTSFFGMIWVREAP